MLMADEVMETHQDATFPPSNAQSSTRTDLDKHNLAPYVKPPLAGVKSPAGSGKVLVIVDYQVDFVSGVFANPTAAAVEDALCARISSFYEAGDPVFYTMDTHPEQGYVKTREGSYMPLHCVPGTPGWEVYGKARKLLTEGPATMVRKGTFGSVLLPGMIAALHEQGMPLHSIELAGVATDICVISNAALLYNAFPECEIIVDEKTSAGTTPQATRASLDIMAGWGVVVRG